ncbi:hypothetical protein N7478_003404 [Penicillium angulare]|uniref:uncharacterized protein n=1 Tax=Penicillium angulare TaxID=116970 RepID=UPI002541D4EB|nr:uncharacterized protein N7478_003404 [Penicillium angulare]KAJ5287718.1 hypothetical protein N7478_003404 [Penicillium angulare]
MCLYKAIWYYECQHVRFQLHTLCNELLDQLYRINEIMSQESQASQDEAEKPVSCLPRLVAPDGLLVMKDKGFQDGGATNIIQWVTDLVDPCPSCALNLKLHLKKEM